MLCVFCPEHIEYTEQKDTSYKLFSIDRFSYIVPIMVGLDAGRTWFFTQAITLFICTLLHKKHVPVLIVVTAYSDSVTISERVLALTFSLPTTT